MAYQTLENISNFGLRDFLNFPNLDNGTIFYPLMLFVFFLVFASLTFFKEITREAKGNPLSSLAVGGFVTTSIAVILSLLQLISNATMITTLVISMIFIALYLLTKE